MDFKEISVSELNKNAFKLIGKNWMLITSGTEEKLNTMTASWGGLGVIWNTNVSFIFVRPQRYTFEFLEENDYYTLSFFGDEYKKVLSYCGKNSGRNVDKISATGLKVIHDKAPYFEQAKLVMICKKMYSEYINPNGFKDVTIEANYENGDYHKMFIGEITKCLIK